MVSGTHEKKINVTCLFWDVCAVNVGSFLPKFCDSLLAPSSSIEQSNIVGLAQYNTLTVVEHVYCGASRSCFEYTFSTNGEFTAMYN